MKKKAKTLLKTTHDSLKKLHWKINSLKKTDDTRSKKESEDHVYHHHDRMTVDVSVSSIAKATVAVLMLLWLASVLVEIQSILLLFFVSFLLSAALDPFVDHLQTKKIPRGISVIMIYLVFFFVIGIIISSVIPLVASQTQELAGRVNAILANLVNGGYEYPFADTIRPYLAQFYDTIDIKLVAERLESSLELIASQLLSVAGNTWEAVKMISNGFLNLLLVLILTFFMVVEEQAIESFFLSLFPARHGKYITGRFEAVKSKIGHWLRGQLMLSLSVGLLTFIGLLILGVEYTTTLALIAGITELIPVVGPLLAWVIALPIAANHSWMMMISVTVLYFVIQQVENNFLVPIIMKKAVGLSPIIILFAMMVGAQYLGILGLILAIPVATSLAIFVQDYLHKVK